MYRGLKMAAVIMFFAVGLLFSGCSNEEKIRNLDFTVISPECAPQELLNEIREKKEEEFQLTFRDGNYLYLCTGYGKKETGGYSICVKELYLTSSAIVLDTTLLGPKYTDENKKSEASYPYIIIKMEYIDAPVIFS